ncbi:MAG TPA: DNA cytosine methyltransferase [Lacunisphaera sp.]|nr:DNA cytosine methyltransferase [Lacunisphaera sp.]
MTARIRTHKSRQLPLFSHGSDLVVDLFAGGGGASTGIEAALGRPVDIAINHDPTALAVHCANHPQTRHMTTDVWDVDPVEATGGRPVALLWCSPDCKHFSNAKGDVPRSKRIRSLAWVAIRWAKAVRPAVIMLENVREFQGWGPLGDDGKPIRARKGETFRKWVGMLRGLGYTVEHRLLDSADYGALTRRKRLFLVARCDGQPIVWPVATHGPKLQPFHTAAECIDWNLPCPSIFGRQKPLAEKTMWRIAQGLKRFVFESPRPFIVKVNHGKWEPRHESLDSPLSTVTATQRGHAVVTPVIAEPGQRHGRGQASANSPLSTIVAKGRHALVAPTLQQSGYGERPGQAARVPGLHQPLGTLVDGQKHALVAAFLAKHFGDPLRESGGGVVVGSELSEPIGTVTARDHHSLAAVSLAKFRGTADNQTPATPATDPLPTISGGGIHSAQVCAFLSAYYGSDGTGGQALGEPARTITTKARLGLVTVEGIEYQIVDIGFRMLEPHELLRAQFGRFADAYDMRAAKSKRDKIRLIGNSVCPEMAEVLVRANAPEHIARAA